MIYITVENVHEIGWKQVNGGTLKERCYEDPFESRGTELHVLRYSPFDKRPLQIRGVEKEFYASHTLA